MNFLSKKSAAPSGGTIGPLVNIAGGAPGTVYTGDHTGITDSTDFTIAMRVVLSENPAANDVLFGWNYGTLAFNAGGRLYHSFAGLFDDNPTGEVFSNGSVMCIMMAFDGNSGLTGSRCISLYVNGVDYFGNTTSLTNYFWNINDNDEPIKIFNNGGGGLNSASLQTNGVWFADQAIDPATDYSDFFDGSDQWQALPTNGDVGGVSPVFWQNGNVAAWNSGSDNNSNSYTMNGTVT